MSRALEQSLRHAFDWATSSEGWSYWCDLAREWGRLPKIRTELDLVEYLDTPIPKTREQFDIHRGNPHYCKMQLIAKYYDRFGTLPSVELLEALL